MEAGNEVARRRSGNARGGGCWRAGLGIGSAHRVAAGRAGRGQIIEQGSSARRRKKERKGKGRPLTRGACRSARGETHGTG